VTLDISQLTVQAPGEEPMKLEINKPARTREPYAYAGCQWCDTNKLVVVQGPRQFVRRGARITCNGKTYNVVDIKPNRMIIVGPSESETNVLTRAASPGGKD
jgi:hypothetical protein